MANEYSIYNAENILKNVNDAIVELEAIQGKWSNEIYCNPRYKLNSWLNNTWSFNIRKVYDEFSIFDWWGDKLSLSQLKQMRNFLKTAIKLGFNGYVCFNIGAVGCTNGMWASNKESEDCYSPKDDNCLYHSFVSNENYWDVCLNGKWSKNQWKLADIKKFIVEAK